MRTDEIKSRLDAAKSKRFSWKSPTTHQVIFVNNTFDDVPYLLKLHDDDVQNLMDANATIQALQGQIAVLRKALEMMGNGFAAQLTMNADQKKVCAQKQIELYIQQAREAIEHAK